MKTSYTPLPLTIPDNFLQPLENPQDTITVQRIDFESVLREYKGAYAVVLDGVLSEGECGELIRFAEMSQGGHGNFKSVKDEDDGEGLGFEGGDDGDEVKGPLEKGWIPATINAGVGSGDGVLATGYRDSDRIIWDQREVVGRLWKRVLQAKDIKEDIGVLKGKKFEGWNGVGIRKGERWVSTEQGINERMRFLRYGSGQYFRAHIDSAYEDPDSSERAFFTIHLYLNDSAQELEKNPGALGFAKDSNMLRGGATIFHSSDLKKRLNVDPKAGRVLIFQHRRLLHSGDDVLAGVKYTVRSDLMYKLEDGLTGEEGKRVV